MKSKTFRRLTSIVLSVMLVLSMCVTGISVSAETAEATTAIFTVAGDFLTPAWEPSANEMVEGMYELDGIVYDYAITVPAEEGTHNFKVTNGTWDVSYPSNNVSFAVTDYGDVTIYFNSETHSIAVDGEYIDNSEFAVESITAVGNGDGTWLNGANWDVSDVSNDMTEVVPGVWEITYEDIDACDSYQVKFVVNHSWAYNWGIDGVFDSQTKIKQVVEQDGSTVTLRIDINNFNFKTKEGTVITEWLVTPPETVPETTVPLTTEPVETEPETTEPDTSEYVEMVEIYYTMFTDCDWENVYCSYGKEVDQPLISWPGVEMNRYNRTTYYTEIPSNATYVVFNNGADGETAELTIPTDGRNVYSEIYKDWFYLGSIEPSHGSYDETEPVETEPETTEPQTDPTEPETTEPQTTEPETTPSVEYCLFGYINGANYGCEEDYETIGEYKFVDGKLTTSFDETSYVAVKTGDNANWYMTDDWAGEVTEVVLYDTSLLSVTANKLMVPGGVDLTFTLVENEDGSLTLSYTIGIEPETTVPVETEPETTEPQTDPTEPETTEPQTTEPETTPSVEYCLFGYINGANYGCEEDYETIGEYKFVDGKLTTSFDETSYVAVKTGDNANWYMTDDWAGEVTEVVLYDTSLLSVTANKLMVPGGVDLTFTLVENEDGSLTLSYTIGIEPETTVPVETEPETTVPETTEPETTAPADEVVYVVAGSEGLCAYNWVGVPENAPENVMVLSDGVYVKTFTGVRTGETYQFKIVENNLDGTQNWIGDENDGNITIYTDDSFAAATDVVVSYNPETKLISVTGEYVEMVTELEVDAIRTVGNGDDNWLNGVLWDPADDANLMTEISEDVYQITYTNIEASDNYQFKFAANGSWVDNWGGVFEGSGVATEAKYNSASNITFATTYELSNVTITLDLTNFNYSTKTGAMFAVTIEEAVKPSVKITGDINLELTNTSGSVYTGKLALSAGDHSVKLDEFGTELGFGGMFVDSIYKKEYKPEWNSATTFRATGGTYSFSYDVDTNQLTILRISKKIDVEIFGDIDATLTKASDTLYTATVVVEAGEYNFAVGENGIVYSSNEVFTGSIDGAVLSKDSESVISFTCASGICTLSYDIATKILSAKVEETNEEKVSILGDIALDLVNVSGSKYTKTVELEAGSYDFRVNDFGTAKCFKYSFNDSIYKVTYSEDWIGETTLNVTGGKYRFTFDNSTSQLTVLKVA